jgi:hypothetical protein
MTTGTHHTFLEFMAGDDWEISATLTNENGVPYPGPPSAMSWLLYDAANVRVLEDGDYSIAIVDPDVGVVTISVAAAVTATIGRGVYRDAFRISQGGTISTLLRGSIYVEADPWQTTRSPEDIVTLGTLTALETADHLALASSVTLMRAAPSSLRSIVDPYRKWP